MDVLSIAKFGPWLIGIFPKIKMFWNFLNGPAIGAILRAPMGELCILEVKNIRGGVAIVRVFLDDVTDEMNESLGKIVSPIELSDTGDKQVGRQRLFGKAWLAFAVLIVNNNDPLNPCLFVKKMHRFQEGTGQETVARAMNFVLVQPTPIEQRKQIRLTLRVVFYSDEERPKEKMDKVLRCAIIPIPDSNRYDVRIIKPRHASIFD